MRLVSVFVAACLLAGCSNQDSPIESHDEVYDSEVVFFIDPDAAALDSLRQVMGENFYIVADDMNYYRAQLYPLLDSLSIPYTFSDRRPLRFVVRDSVVTYSWRDVDASWFMVVYDGRDEPRVTSSIELADSLREQMPRR